jgi:predicted N-acetyltransferase YhbS
MVLINIIEVNGEKPVFQLFFLKEDEDQSVEVEEVEDIDASEVQRRIEQGESVFITRKNRYKLNTSLVAAEDTAEPWYFSHI